MSTAKVAAKDIIMQDHRKPRIGDVVHFGTYHNAAIITEVQTTSHVNLWVLPKSDYNNHDEYPKLEHSIGYSETLGYTWHYQEECDL